MISLLNVDPIKVPFSQITSIYFQMSALLYTILIMFFYFSKEKLKTLENSIYGSLLISTFVVLLADISSVLTGVFLPEWSFLNVCLGKLYLILLMGWVFLFTYYIFVISSKKNPDQILPDDHDNIMYFKKIGRYITIVFIFLFLYIIIDPIKPKFEAVPVEEEITHTVFGMFTTGTITRVCYAIAGLAIVSWLIMVFSNKRAIKKKKYIPVVAFVACATLSILIQMQKPQVLLVSAMLSFITTLTYFTLENPDVRMIAELNLAKENAEKASKAKTDFLSSMSHEIRTPLNAIVGFSQALLEEDLPASSKEEISDIVSAADNLLETVNGILDISKIEANRLEIINGEYNSHKLMHEIETLIKARIGEKPIELRTHIDEKLPPILYGDSVRIRQVIINLLTNAVKYTDYGYIDLTVQSFSKGKFCRLIVSVKDTGMGIKQENLQDLFGKFNRFDLEKNTSIEGTGLGLAITKNLVELMNGKIVAESVYGEGSTFTIQVDQKIVPKSIEEFEQEEKYSDKVGFEALNSKIIVVDDNKVNLKVAERLLRDYKANITLLPSGIDCINKVLEDNHYDLILMDDMMPKMTGVQTLQNLKKIMGFKTPVVALTANAISGMKEQYLAAGFDDYLPKPIDRKQLDAVLRKYLTPTGDTQKVIVKAAKPAILIVSNEVFNYYVEEQDVRYSGFLSKEAHMLVEKMTIEGEVVPPLVKKEESHVNNVNFLKASGVDVDHGLELLGDMDMYNMTVTGFLEEQVRRVPEMGKFKKTGDMANYAILVHSMKSDSKYLGLMKLADLAYQHEMASKGNDINFVNDNYDELIEEVNITYNILSEYVGTKKTD